MFAYARRNAVKLVGEKSSAFDLARGRLKILTGVFVIAYMMIAARAVDLSVIQGVAARAVNPEARIVKPLADAVPRGDIYDRNGVLLASTLKTVSLYIDPKLIYDHEATAVALAKIFPSLSAKEIYKRLETGPRNVRLRRDLTPAQRDAILQIGEPGLIFEYEDRRVYPQTDMAPHILGFVNVDNEGLAGVERGLNGILNQGKDAHLSIDIRIQHALRREIQKTMRDFNAIAGSGVVMDAQNGEILAGVSLPDFDPRAPGDANPDHIFNRLTLGAYELGSVFKIFSTAAYLEAFNPPMNQSFDATQPVKAGRFQINDYHAQDRVLTIPEVFMHSSNIGSALMGQALGEKRLRGFYKDIGLLRPLSFDIKEIAKPGEPAHWRADTVLTASFGHGITTTPMQLAAATASIVNGGYLVQPRLTIEHKNKSEPSIRVVSEKTSHRMRQLMRLTVTEGTAKQADVKGYNIGGKTGTAEKIVAGRYDKNKLISSFVAAFPMESPKYVVYIVIDEPKPNAQSHGYATAGWVAAPAAARVIASMGAILGIAPEITPVDQDIASSLLQYVSAEHR